ncbi:Ig-like domain-containing protein, partial [Candidatus Marithrix sp. Canyon 246]|uniref:Ig-like domain-containing protein n=1 Tax=Candidatus Marithrix sp. Canyon 246 TaxID=1827136 RepID=UPI000A4D05AA
MNQLNSKLLFPLNNKYKFKLYSSSMLLASLCTLTPAAYALSVNSQTPTVNALAQNADSNISIEFDDAMGNPGTHIIVNGSLSGPIDGIFTPSGNNITFDPTNDFKPGETVTVTLTTLLQSNNAQSLSTAKTSQFTVKAGNGGILSDSGQSLGSSSSYSVSLGDVDGDGDLDAVVANFGEANKLWLNDGSGTFSDSGQSLGNFKSYSVSLGDVDGDGDLDAVVANFGQANKLWLNDGSGTFSDSGQSLGNFKSRSVSLGDVDGDGDLDAVVANYSQANKLWLNNPPPMSAASITVNPTANTNAVATNSAITLTLPNSMTGTASSNQASFIVRGSLSGNISGALTDSGNDLIFTPSSALKPGETITVTLTTSVKSADGLGLDKGFSYAFTVQTPAISPGYLLDSGQSLGNFKSQGVSLGDVDGDGDLDAVVANFGEANKLWLNDGSGTFSD